MAAATAAPGNPPSEHDQKVAQHLFILRETGLDAMISLQGHHLATDVMFLRRVYAVTWLDDPRYTLSASDGEVEAICSNSKTVDCGNDTSVPFSFARSSQGRTWSTSKDWDVSSLGASAHNDKFLRKEVAETVRSGRSSRCTNSAQVDSNITVERSRSSVSQCVNLVT